MIAQTGIVSIPSAESGSRLSNTKWVLHVGIAFIGQLQPLNRCRLILEVIIASDSRLVSRLGPHLRDYNDNCQGRDNRENELEK